ncbi:MAG: hypothetical protein QNJ88_07820 [Acidimicrobiia bacterium]|nr:hypothetical protein [Acidimicrobiia bacterium]
MDELIKQLQEKTGLGVDQIKSVVSGVMDFLGDKLPGPIADQVKKLLGDEGGDGDGGGDEGGGLLDQAKDMLGGFMGGDG